MTLCLPLLLCIATSILNYGTAAAATSPPPYSNTSFALKLIDVDSIYSPLYPGNLTTSERHRRLLRYHEAHLLRRKSSSRLHKQPMDVGIRPNVNNILFQFTVELSIGSPPVPQRLLLDSASDITWAQCHPCSHENCFTQNPPFYHPEQSASAAFIGYEDFHCPPGSLNINGHCGYQVSYGDRTGTIGVRLTDTFTFPSKSGQPLPITVVHFGCSLTASKNIFSGTQVAGVFGMDRGSDSFLMQMSGLTGRVFSYCFTGLLQQDQPSYLRFGNDIAMPANTLRTPIISNDMNPKLYYLDLLGLSVNGVRLPTPPEWFAINPVDKSGGTIIDSGLVYTELIRPAYQVVEDYLVHYFGDDMGLTRVDAHAHGFSYNLCYAPPHDDFDTFATMTFHFRGADLYIPEENLFAKLSGSDYNMFCFLVLPDDDFTMLGAVQQANLRVTYDLPYSELLFAPMIAPDTCAWK